MRICFVNHPLERYSPISGGAVSTVIAQVAKWFVQLGHDVVVISRLDGERPYSFGEIVAVAPPPPRSLARIALGRVDSRLKRWDWPDYRTYKSDLRRRLAGMRPAPDLVLGFNDIRLPLLVRSTAPKARVLLWLHNEVPTNLDDPRQAFAAANAVVACSDYVREWTITRYGLTPGTVHTVLNGVDLEAFYPRSDYLESNRPVRVISHGRLDPNKGFHLVADAVEKLAGRGLPVCMTLAGPVIAYGISSEEAQAYGQRLVAQVEASGGRYLGRVPHDQVPELLRQHDIACAPSISTEPFGLSMVEALACGTALITSRRGGIPQAVGDAAVLIDPDQPGVVTSALETLLTDPGQLRSRKLAGIRRAAQLPWSGVAEQLLALVTGS